MKDNSLGGGYIIQLQRRIIHTHTKAPKTKSLTPVLIVSQVCHILWIQIGLVYLFF
ncbi:hypothetical protein BC941DRAFT_517824 [Chlamydoabsidia padenii]|nr:hypothetical protein BC941DRAFT_517824 [Chlamydoabsidia padenii]